MNREEMLKLLCESVDDCIKPLEPEQLDAVAEKFKEILSTTTFSKSEVTEEEVMKGICWYFGNTICKTCLRERTCRGNATDLKREFVMHRRKNENH